MKDIFSLLAYPHAIKLDLKISDSMIMAAIAQSIESDLVEITGFQIKENEMELDLVLSVAFVRKSFQIRFLIQQVTLAPDQLFVELEVQNEILMPLLSVLKMLKFAFVSMLEVDGKQVRINLSPQLAEMLQKQDPALREYIKHVRITEIRQEAQYLLLSVMKD